MNCGKYRKLAREFQNQKEIDKINKKLDKLTSKQHDNKNPKVREALKKQILTLLDFKITLQKINGVLNVKNGK